MQLMNDCHSASAKGNWCKGVLDSIAPSGIAIFVTAVLEIDISEMRSQDTCNMHVGKLSHSTHM